jgi:hypothetical protein
LIGREWQTHEKVIDNLDDALRGYQQPIRLQQHHLPVKQIEESLLSFCSTKVF